MNKHKHLTYLLIAFASLSVLSFFYFNHNLKASDKEEIKDVENVVAEEVKTPEHRFEMVEIEPGDTYGVLMSEKTDLSSQEVNGIYQAAHDIYDLAQIKAGKLIELSYDYVSDELESLVYKVDNETELLVEKNEDGTFLASLRDIPYKIKVVKKQGTVESSLYESAMSQEIDERAIIAMADAFQWEIDFAMDPRSGDEYSFIYEEKYLDGDYVRPGKVLAAKYVNVGEPYYLYYYHESDDNEGYFDEDGNSAQKMFLKAPVAFRYISSGYTTGLRYVEAFNTSTGHRAIDYAAALGTPIRSVGDGTVSFSGWNGPYGNMVKIRHNGTYSTNYAHMSKIAVSTGEKVKQGEVIGYVGSTGFSTGPHLHYEMVKNGVKINPLFEVLPPGEALTGDSLLKYQEYIKDLKADLDK